MKKYIEIYNNQIPEALSLDWVKKAVKAAFSDSIQNTSMSRWARGLTYPPVKVVRFLAITTKTPAAQLVGQTEVASRLEKDFSAKERDIKLLLEERGISHRRLAELMETDPNTAGDIIKNYPNIRLNSMIALSEALGLSIDYLLGLTDYRTWEEEAHSSEKPFADVDYGTPAYVAPAATPEANGFYCLVSNDGRTIFTADGRTRLAKDEFFRGRIVTPLSIKGEDDA